MESKIVKELEKKITKEQEGRWFEIFSKQATFRPPKFYEIGRLISEDTRELFLMFVADLEDIDYKGKRWEAEEEVE